MAGYYVGYQNDQRNCSRNVISSADCLTLLTLYIGLVLAVLPRCMSRCPVTAVLSILPNYSCSVIVSLLTPYDFPVLAVLSCLISTVLSWLSCSGFLVVLLWLSSLGCPVTGTMSKLFWSSCQYVPPYCNTCPVFAVLLWLSCHSWLSWHSCSVMAVLSQLLLWLCPTILGSPKSLRRTVRYRLGQYLSERF
jgi:hypothetical protein